MTEGTHLYGDRAPHNEQFVVLSASGNLTLERVLTGTANQIVVTDGGAGAAVTLSTPQDIAAASSPTFAGVTLNNTGLHLLDTNASHDLIIAPGSDLTADRTLTITTGDAARTITLSGNPTLNDWFDQAVKAASTPTFAGANLDGAVTINDSDADVDTIINGNTVAGLLTVDGGNEQVIVKGYANYGSYTELTLDADGKVTVTKTNHTLDTFEDAASDTLVQIIGGNAQDRITFKIANSARDVIIQDSEAGDNNISLNGGANVTLGNVRDRLTMEKHGSIWVEISRSIQ